MPSLVDVLNKSNALYTYCANVVIESRPKTAYSASILKQVKRICTTHQHKLFDEIPSDICKKIGEYMDGEDVLNVKQVSRRWNTSGQCNYFWCQLYLKSYGNSVWNSVPEKDVLVDPLPDFQQEFIKQKQYTNAKHIVQRYELKCLEQEEKQSEQLEQLRGLAHLGHLATYASAFTALWHCIDKVVVLLQWSIVIGALVVIISALVAILLSSPSRTPTRYFGYLCILGGVLSFGAIISAVLANAYLKTSGFPLYHKGLDLSHISSIASILRLIHIAALVLSVAYVARFRTNSSFYALTAAILSVFVYEIGLLFSGVQTPLASLIAVITPVIIFCIRFVPWGYLCAVALISYFDELSRMAWLKHLWIPASFVVGAETTLYQLGYLNPLIMWLFSSGSGVMCHLVRFGVWTSFVGDLVKYLAWIVVRQSKYRNELIEEERKHLKITMSKVLLVEVGCEYLSISTPALLQIPAMIRGVLMYLYWSKCITVLAIGSLVYRKQLPRMTYNGSIRSRIHSALLLSASVALVCHDVYYDLLDVHAPTQMRTSTLWLGLWLCF